MPALVELGSKIEPAQGKLGVLTVGLGSVVTTLVAGIETINMGLIKPIGSVTQIGRIRLGQRTEGRNPLIKDFVPLANLKDLVFGSWDIIPDNAYEAAKYAEVLDKHAIEQLRPGLAEVVPMKGVFDQSYVKRLRGTHVKQGNNKMDLAMQVMDDITRFKEREECDRVVMLFAASTEKYIKATRDHKDLARFEKALVDNSPHISPSMIYAYAALQSGVPFINGTPSLTVDIPALRQLAQEREVPVAGKDFKTGQTLMKTIISPGIKARMLGLSGWASLNVLGNRDGKVLDDPGSFKSKEESKKSVLDDILEPDLYPDLYGDYDHLIRISHYGPAGDGKEAWDRIDLVGWLGKKMIMRVNFHCEDSTLAAPVALDLILYMDLAKRAGMKGVQEWLSFYFKSPMTAPGLPPVNNLFEQEAKLKNNLRHLMGEELITHLGRDYYE